MDDFTRLLSQLKSPRAWQLLTQLIMNSAGPNDAATPIQPGIGFDSYAGIYEPEKDWQARVQDAFRLGLSPPETSMDLQSFIFRPWPQIEQEMLFQQNQVRNRLDGGPWYDLGLLEI